MGPLFSECLGDVCSDTKYTRELSDGFLVTDHPTVGVGRDTWRSRSFSRELQGTEVFSLPTSSKSPRRFFERSRTVFGPKCFGVPGLPVFRGNGMGLCWVLRGLTRRIVRSLRSVEWQVDTYVTGPESNEFLQLFGVGGVTVQQSTIDLKRIMTHYESRLENQQVRGRGVIKKGWKVKSSWVYPWRESNEFRLLVGVEPSLLTSVDYPRRS